MKEIIITTSEDHVSYEVAQALHNLGVVGIDNGSDSWNIRGYNVDDQKLIFSHRGNTVIGYIIAPPTAVVVKWLGEQYGVYIEKLLGGPKEHWCNVHAKYNGERFLYLHVSGAFSTPQEAYDRAILHILQHIVSPLIHKDEQTASTGGA